MNIGKLKNKWWFQPTPIIILISLIISLFLSVRKEDPVDTKWVLLGILTFINIFLAKIDSVKILNNERICHGLNASIYALLCCSTYLLTHSIIPIFAFALVRIPIFNTSLNIMRGLPPTYISKFTTSIIDRLTYRIVEKLGYWEYNGLILGLTILLMCI